MTDEGGEPAAIAEAAGFITTTTHRTHVVAAAEVLERLRRVKANEDLQHGVGDALTAPAAFPAGVR
jgi:hypothetical protein